MRGGLIEGERHGVKEVIPINRALFKKKDIHRQQMFLFAHPRAM